MPITVDIMIKQIRKRLSSSVTDWMANHHSDFRKIKVDFKGTSWAGCDVFSKQTANARRSWIVVGGNSGSSYVTAVLYWTRKGTPWEHLSASEWRNSAKVPPTGGMQQPAVRRADPSDSIRSGFDAAKATLGLMHDAQKRLPPKEIIAADDPGLQKLARAQRLWNNAVVRKATIESLVQSVKVLATLWQAAWKAGGGNALPAGFLVKFAEKDLSAIYRREKDFLKSLSLDKMASSGDYEPPP